MSRGAREQETRGLLHLLATEDAWLAREWGFTRLYVPLHQYRHGTKLLRKSGFVGRAPMKTGPNSWRMFYYLTESGRREARRYATEARRAFA